jgi:YD repeat-containing protein
MNKILFILVNLVTVCAASGQTWAQINSPTNLTLKSCSFTDQDTGWVITADLIYKTTDGGFTWTNQSYPPDPPNNDRYFNSVHFINSNVGIIACLNVTSTGYNPALLSTVLWTDDGGVNWLYKDLGNPGGHWDAKLINTNTAYAAGSYGNFKKTTDGGTTWTDLNVTGGFSGLKLYPISEDTVYYAGLDNLNIKGGYGKTVNGGTTWNSSVISTNTHFEAISFANYNKGWIGGAGGEIKITNDAGATWTPCNSGVTSEINDMAFTDTTNGWAVTDNGKIIHSANGGLNWNLEYNGSARLTAITFTKPNNIGYAVGDSGRILKYSANAGIKNLNSSSSIKLFPNPSDLSATLRSEKPFNNATLTLKNSSGQTAKEIKNISGHVITFSCDQLPAGFYFLYLKEGNTIITDKLIITKP